MGYLFNRKSFRKGVGLKKYKVNQGICCDGKYIYSVFERKKPHECKIRKFTFDNKTIKTSKTLHIGHGNDLTYKNGWIYATHSKSGNVIHTIDAISLKKGADKRVKGLPKKISKKPSFNAIAAMPNGFALKLMGSRRIIVVDNNFNYVRSFKMKKKVPVSPQGMDYHDGKLYRVYSNFQKSQNKVAVFDMKGNLLRLYKVKVKGEAEGIFFCVKKFYMSIYRKYKKKGQKKKFVSRLYRISGIK
jgi:hypothetical protein